MEEESTISIVRESLNQQKVKLWLPPYLNTDGSVCNASLETLANSLSKSLTLSQDKIMECLKTLQQKAVENLKDRSKFESTGIASLKVRAPSNGGTITINIKLSENGSQLKSLIADQLKEEAGRLKIIGKGKVLLDDVSLEQQDVKHGMQLMVLKLSTTVEEQSAREKNDKLVASTKEDINLLAGTFRPDGSDFMQVTNQSGKPLPLPKKAQISLYAGIALHEKGRAALKKENYSLALFLFLEAEKELKLCPSSVLEKVDNVGILNLDIVWCYLCLKSINQLPDAESRLGVTEQIFHRCYGRNMERLLAVKGSAEGERALFLRLHLLQAIIHYHKNNFQSARKLLQQVEEELSMLKVDDDQLSQLIGLGYKITESRLALRESAGDLNTAVAVIENKRAEALKNYEAEQKAMKVNREKMSLGKCKDGSWVEPEFVKALISMGYSKGTAKMALSKTNNNIPDAINLIQEYPERFPLHPASDILQTVEQFIALGFQREVSAAILKKHNGNVNSALDELLATGAIPDFSRLTEDVQPSTSSAASAQLEETEGGKRKSRVSDSTDANDQPTSLATLSKIVKKKSEKLKAEQDAKRQAFSRVSDGINASSDDHLDLTLAAEEQFLKHYKELLSRNTEQR